MKRRRLAGSKWPRLSPQVLGLRRNHNGHAAVGRVRASIARLGLALPVDRYSRYAQSTQQRRDVLRAFFGEPGLFGQALSVRQEDWWRDIR